MNRRGGPAGGMAPTEKPQNFKGTLKELWRYISAYRASLIVVLLFAVASTVFNIIGPKILGKAITELFDGLIAKFTGEGSIDFGMIGRILFGLLALYLISSCFAAVMGWIMTGVTQRICYSMRKNISVKIGRMPMQYFEAHSVGDVLSRITNDVDMLGQGLNQSVTTLITAVATLIGVLVMMLSISPVMTLIVFIILPISILLITVVMRFSQKHFKRQQEYLGEINGQIEETIGGHNIVKLFNYESRAKEEFAETNRILFASAWKSQFLSGLMMPVMNFVGNLGYVGVAAAGGILAFKGSISVGDIQAFIQYARNFTMPTQQIAQVSNMLQGMTAAAERVFQFLDEDEEAEPDAEKDAGGTSHETADGRRKTAAGHKSAARDARRLSAANERFKAEAPDAREAEEPAAQALGDVTFEHIHFGYDPGKIIINDFTCAVNAGQMIAIVGPTGAGKTTLVKLLMRFYDLQSGVIRVDGEDIARADRRALRRKFGMVLQDTWLFKGSIMENIRYGKLGATDAEVCAAAKAAHVHRFIKTLPGGYDMELNEEADNISQGQKQLLTIARAILADRPILVLDEATSSVDTRTEEQIQKAMKNLMHGGTCFVIAHRLSTIKDADRILVMRNGDIAEQGTHKDLLAANGFYAELYNSQFETVSV
ncbi:MAG: ABC transporter ATP-binding protein/permease [Clostridiales Family XIII bacterium]|nr:ABC transporter ATP-binding protein/permease [Clostridiales Family XIII bacterium]